MIEILSFFLRVALSILAAIALIFLALFIYAACKVSAEEDYKEALEELEEEEKRNNEFNSK